VTTDIIVGFPGETDDEWKMTMESVETIGFGHIHIFSYSPREGTKAAGLANPVEESVKKFDSNVDVLWESQKKNENGRLVFTGYTPNFCKVESNGENDMLLAGRVKATQLLSYSNDRNILTGKVLLK